MSPSVSKECSRTRKNNPGPGGFPTPFPPRVFFAFGLLISLLCSPFSGSPPSKGFAASHPEKLPVFVSLDRLSFSPGENLFARIIILRNPSSASPAGVFLEGRVDILAPGGRTITSAIVRGKHGHMGFSWSIPEDARQGDYLLKVTFPGLAAPAAEGFFRILGDVDRKARAIPSSLSPEPKSKSPEAAPASPPGKIEIFPEGGTLVENLPCRVYFKAPQTEVGVRLSGRLVDSRGRTVCPVRSENRGKGRFVFIPRGDLTYSLDLREPGKPEGSLEPLPLPPARKAGVVISTLQDVVPPTGPVRLRITGTGTGTCLLTISGSSGKITETRVPISPWKPQEISVDVGESAGVLCATLSDEADRLIARRLLFRENRKRVNLSLGILERNPPPGSEIHLVVRATDEGNRPCEAWVGLTVTELPGLDTGPFPPDYPNLPSMFLLGSSGRSRDGSCFFFDRKNPLGAAAVDLELATRMPFSPVKPAQDQAPPLRHDLETIAPSDGERSNDVFFAREFAHRPPRPGFPDHGTPGPRTVFWSSGIRTDPRTGEARVSFFLNNSRTPAGIFADCFNLSGDLGAAAGVIEPVAPFSLNATIPPVLMFGDRLEVPVELANNTSASFRNVVLTASAGFLTATSPGIPFDLPAHSRIRKLLPLGVGISPGTFSWTIETRVSRFPLGLRGETLVLPHFAISSGPASNPWGVSIQTDPVELALREGETATLEVCLRNELQRTAPWPIIAVGIPAGGGILSDRLEDLVKSGRISSFKIVGGEVLILLSQLSPGQEIKIPIVLFGQIPGRFRGLPSRVFFHRPEDGMAWNRGVIIEIVPR